MDFLLFSTYIYFVFAQQKGNHSNQQPNDVMLPANVPDIFTFVLLVDFQLVHILHFIDKCRMPNVILLNFVSFFNSFLVGNVGQYKVTAHVCGHGKSGNFKACWTQMYRFRGKFKYILIK